MCEPWFTILQVRPSGLNYDININFIQAIQDYEESFRDQLPSFCKQLPIDASMLLRDYVRNPSTSIDMNAFGLAIVELTEELQHELEGTHICGHHCTGQW